MRKVDIIKWGTPVAKQFNIRGVPHFVLYGPDGKKMKEGHQVYREIINWNQ